MRFLASLVILAALSWPTFAQFPSPPKSLQGISNSLEEAIRSASQDANRPSMAMIDRERARSMSYDNQLKHVQTYFEKRKMSRSFRDEERRSMPTSEQRSASRARNRPDRLTVRQFDAMTGRIEWPVLLQTPEYAEKCRQLDRLFNAHCRDGGGINTKHYAAIQSTSSELLTQIKKNFASLNAQQFTYTRRFLESLQYEARFDVGS